MDINIKEQKIITEDEVDKSKGFTYDFGENDKMSAETLPNADDVLDQVIQILECMDTAEMRELRKTKQALFEQIMEEKFEKFSFQYYSIFKMILSGDDITPLFKMLEIIGKINKGRCSFEDGEREVGCYLNQFLPPELLDKLASGNIDTNNNKKRNKGR